jgi:hypothetical protein
MRSYELMGLWGTLAVAQASLVSAATLFVAGYWLRMHLAGRTVYAGRHRARGTAWAHWGTGEHRPAPGAGHSLLGRVRARLDHRVDTQVEELVGDIRWGWASMAYGRGAAAYGRLNERAGARLRKIRKARAAVLADAAEAVGRSERSTWGTPMVDDSWT